MASASGGDKAPTGEKSKGGRPPKAAEEKVEQFRVGLTPVDIRNLNSIHGKLCHSNMRDTIRYLIALDSAPIAQINLPAHSLLEFNNIQQQHQLPNQRSTLEYLIRLEQQREASTLMQPAACAAAAAGPPSMAPKRPIYASAGVLPQAPKVKRPQPEIVEPEEPEEDIDDETVGHDPYLFDEEASEEEDDEEAAACYRTFVDASLSLTDHAGNVLSDAATQLETLEQQEAWRVKVAKAKEQEPILFDYSDSPRLLPENYYAEFSKTSEESPREMQCREYIPVDPEIDKYGSIGQKLTREQRFREKKMVDAVSVVNDGRWIVEFHALLKLISPKCYVFDCSARNNMKEIELRRMGAVLKMTIRCHVAPIPHEKYWYSSRQLWHHTETRSRFFSMNALLASAILVSGNQFTKIDHFFRTLNVRGISKNMYLMNQNYAVAPVVDNCLRSTQETIVNSLRHNGLSMVLAGDGMNDSPGKCAAYCTYTMTIVATGKQDEAGKKLYENNSYILTCDVVDKRFISLKSSPMEACGFLRALLCIASYGADSMIDEIVTDKNLTIVNLLSSAKLAGQYARSKAAFINKCTKLLEKYPDVGQDDVAVLLSICQNVLHQLDIWHGAKNLRKNLRKDVTKKEKALMKPDDAWKDYLWHIASIKRHFWYCAANCDGDVNKFKAKWMEIPNHVQGKHVWDRGFCSHGELTEKEIKRAKPLKEYLDPDDRNPERKVGAVRAIRARIVNPRFLKDLDYYVKFRHTGEVECVNSTTLKWCNKRTYYQFTAMQCHKTLAVLDWNDGVHDKIIRNRATGQAKIRKRWSKRAGSWVLFQLKEPRSYRYVPHLLAAILYERSVTTFRFTGRKVTLPIRAEDPAVLGVPNYAKFQKSLTSVIASRKSRFSPYFYNEHGAEDEEEEDAEEVGRELEDFSEPDEDEEDSDSDEQSDEDED